MAAALLATMATGCRSTRNATATAPEATATTEAVSAYTVMTFSGTVEGIGVSGQLRLEHGKTIWCSVSKFVELGRAMATPDSVWVRMPLLGRNEEGDYRDVEQRTGKRVSFGELEAILESDDAEERIAALARQLGINAQVKITRRETVDRLTFPFSK